MQIKRLLDDREVCVGDRLFDAQGAPMRSCFTNQQSIA